MAGDDTDAITAGTSAKGPGPNLDEILIEPFEVRCSDGWTLRGEVVAPATPRAVAIVGHAMMVDRRTLDKPRGDGLVSTLVRHGIAVVWPDLRGHGASGPRASEGGRWSYDDLVAHDVPTLVALARQRFSGLPVVAVGHSLFGHATIAHLARFDPALVDGVALLAVNIATRAWRSHLGSWLPPSLLIGGMAVLSLSFGRFPTRLLRMGNNDEALPYVMDFLRWVRRRDWVARDGFVYTDGLSRITAPVRAWVGRGDVIFSPPRDAEEFVKLIDHRNTARVVGRATGLPFDPGHMDIAVDARCRPVWREIADFVVGSDRRGGERDG